MTVSTTHADERDPHKNSGSGVKAHTVHLKGHFGKNAEMRAGLIAEINNCVAVMRKAGMPHQELRPDQIPAVVQVIETDLYIATNRVMKIVRSTLNGYSPTDCSLDITRQDTATLASMNGICNINLTKKTAVGVCDAAIHARAPLLTSLMALHENASPASKARRPVKTGATKSIAGLKCDVYQSTSPVQQSVCISNAGSFLASPLLSFTGIIPGIHLEVISEHLTNQMASEAHLDADVSPEIFSVSKDIKIKSMPEATR